MQDYTVHLDVVKMENDCGKSSRRAEVDVIDSTFANTCRIQMVLKYHE